MPPETSRGDAEGIARGDEANEGTRAREERSTDSAAAAGHAAETSRRRTYERDRRRYVAELRKRKAKKARDRAREKALQRARDIEAGVVEATAEDAVATAKALEEEQAEKRAAEEKQDAARRADAKRAALRAFRRRAYALDAAGVGRASCAPARAAARAEGLFVAVCGRAVVNHPSAASEISTGRLGTRRCEKNVEAPDGCQGNGHLGGIEGICASRRTHLEGTVTLASRPGPRQGRGDVRRRGRRRRRRGRGGGPRGEAGAV